MIDNDFIAERIAERVRELTSPLETTSLAGPPVEAVVGGLREALLGGETHYTDCPGIAELREHIAAALGRTLETSRSKDNVIVTNSDAEALFACLLGIRMAHSHASGLDAVFPAVGERESRGRRNRELATLVGYTTRLDEAPSPGQLVGRFGETGRLVDVLRLAGVDGFSIRESYRDESTLIIGALELDGLSAFPVGFASVTPSLAKHVRTWKQALSICTAAPSQRATLLAIQTGLSE